MRRNEQCPCGSGKKFKKCCLKIEKELRRRHLAGEDLEALLAEYLLTGYYPEKGLECDGDFSSKP